MIRLTSLAPLLEVYTSLPQSRAGQGLRGRSDVRGVTCRTFSLYTLSCVKVIDFTSLNVTTATAPLAIEAGRQARGSSRDLALCGWHGRKSRVDSTMDHYLSSLSCLPGYCDPESGDSGQVVMEASTRHDQ